MPKNPIQVNLLNTIVLGECLHLLKSLPNDCCDLIVSSPPYNIGKAYEKKRSLNDYLLEQTHILRECHRVLKPTGSLFWQVGSYVNDGCQIPLDVKIFPILEVLQMIPRNRIVWVRTHGLHAKNRYSGRHETILWFTKTERYKFFLDPIRVPQKYPNKTSWRAHNKGEITGHPLGKNPGDVWAFRNVKHNHEEQTIHPCQFPEDLIERIILSVTAENDVVLDPYMGVGTVAVVAQNLKRQYLGAEKDSEYHSIALQRLSGNPDSKGNFPNLKTLRHYAEAQGVQDLSKYSFTMQVGKVPTSMGQSKIYSEAVHLQLLEETLEAESKSSAYSRGLAKKEGLIKMKSGQEQKQLRIFSIADQDR